MSENKMNNQERHQKAIESARLIQKHFSIDETFDNLVMKIELDLKYKKGEWTNKVLESIYGK